MTETYTPKHSDAVFRFNDVVEFLFTFLHEEDRIGRLVQVRKGCGQFGSDMYFIRRANRCRWEDLELGRCAALVGASQC